MTTRIPRVAALLALLTLAPLGLAAQVNSNIGAVSLAADRGESLTLALTGASAVNFDLTAGDVATGDASVSVFTEWKLQPSRTNVQLWGYFADASAALSDGGAAYFIPSANVLGRMTTGSPTSFSAFTQTGPFGGAGAALLLFDQAIAPPAHHGDRTDDLDLQIDLTGLTLPGGAYTGTLTLRATAF